MLGLLVILFLLIYLLFSIWVVNVAVKWAKATGRRSWLWGSVTAFLVYNLMFWDLIPTMVVHKYYCETYAGFWLYKTPEQWRKENYQELDDLTPTPSKSEEMGNGWTRYWINQRLFFDVKRERNYVHAIWREQERLVDADSKEVLAEVVNFSRGQSQNILAMGGTFEEFRRAIVLGWGERNCIPSSSEASLIDEFLISIKKFSDIRNKKND